MKNLDPRKMKPSDFKHQHEVDYFNMLANNEAERLLSRIAGSPDFKKAVAERMGMHLNPAPVQPPQPEQQQRQPTSGSSIFGDGQ